MGNKALQASHSSDHKLTPTYTRGGVEDELILDRLIQLPDDVLLSIMSSFSLKEAAVTSLVSHQWNKRLWRNFPLLIFEDSRAMSRIQYNHKITGHERSGFVQRVNNVVKRHEGETIDEFSVSFDLDISCQSSVHKWVGFALDKQVKRLSLDLTRDIMPSVCCTLPLECCLSLERSHNLPGFQHPLTSLCLKSVDVTTQVVDCFLRSCPHLVILTIQNSKSLEVVRVSGASLPLKHLTVYDCSNMKVIDITVPKLLSFRYRSKLEQLHIRDASSLQQVLFQCGKETLSANLDSLSKYFSQLEYLSLTIYSSLELRLGVDCLNALSNLRHLQLTVLGTPEESVLKWIPLIEASPILENLTLKMASRPSHRSILQGLGDVTGNYVGRPLRSLKTLDIRDLVGSHLELQLVNYVVTNAIILEQVIVRLGKWITNSYEMHELIEALSVGDRSPSGAKLIHMR